MRTFTLLCATTALIGCQGKKDDSDTPADLTYPPSLIGFGSCSDPWAPMDALAVPATLGVEVYLWLGDNIYADTEDLDIMQQHYDQLASTSEYKALASSTDMYATWDDHDYGANDAGKEYAKKDQSMKMFLDFWDKPDSDRYDHDGVYGSWTYQADRTLQIIALDTRYFRDGLTANDGSGLNDYLPNDSTSITMLGATQWAWLEQTLKEPADLRIVMSSNQLGHTYNGYESWTLFPAERSKFLDLLASTNAGPTVVLSGDVHWGEISKLQTSGGATLYDFTSSGINKSWPSIEANDNRSGQAVRTFNVGALAIDWPGQTITGTLYDPDGNAKVDATFSFDDVRF